MELAVVETDCSDDAVVTSGTCGIAGAVITFGIYGIDDAVITFVPYYSDEALLSEGQLVRRLLLK